MLRHHLCAFELSQASFSNSINGDKPNWTYLSGRKIRKRARVTDGWTHTEEYFTAPTWCNSHLLLLAATRQSKYQHHITKPQATIVSLLSCFIILFEFQISSDLFLFSAAFSLAEQESADRHYTEPVLVLIPPCQHSSSLSECVGARVHEFNQT